MNKEPKFKVGDKVIVKNIPIGLPSRAGGYYFTFSEEMKKLIGSVVTIKDNIGRYSIIEDRFVFDESWLEEAKQKSDLPEPITITIQPPPGGEFMVGDEVENILTKKRSTLASKDSDVYPLCVPGLDTYTRCGRNSDQAVYPILSFISRPKKKVKKTFKFWVNFYDDGNCYINFSVEAADKSAEFTALSKGPKRIDCKEFTHEIEVEE